MSTTAATREDSEELDSQELAVQLELLREETERLREEYARAKHLRYRRSAGGLAIVGLLATLSGLLMPSERTVLFAIGATGLFAAIMTAYLVPERFVPATVGERVFDAHSRTLASLVATLGLSDRRVYVPQESADASSVRLFVPAWNEYTVPDTGSLSEVLVTTEDDSERGMSVAATGAAIVSEVTDLDDVPGSPSEAVHVLSESLEESLELVDHVTTTLEEEDDRVIFAISGSLFGPLDRFDHPTASFLGSGIAHVFGCPVEVDVVTGDDRSDYLVICTRVPENQLNR